MQTDFNREISWWDAKASKEESDMADESINRVLRWREIERHLDGVKSILDIGAATGVFSIPLARRGFKVTHLDFSPAMLEIARLKADGIKNIEFVEANSNNLPYADRSFDLVINMDGAISFCGSDANRALAEACRVTGKVLIISVSNRAAMIPGWIRTSINSFSRFIPAVKEMLENGLWHQDQFPENAILSKGCTMGYLGTMKAFLPDELRTVLESQHMEITRLGGIGSLACLCGDEAVKRITSDHNLLSEFADMCEYYDKYIMPEGPGTWQRAGLIAVATPSARSH
ncbi:MAG: methyltransferase domain-containing protein [Armatimonadota bacterium]